MYFRDEVNLYNGGKKLSSAFFIASRSSALAGRAAGNAAVGISVTPILPYPAV
jgi:hypothetical protein